MRKQRKIIADQRIKKRKSLLSLRHIIAVTMIMLFFCTLCSVRIYVIYRIRDLKIQTVEIQSKKMGLDMEYRELSNFVKEKKSMERVLAHAKDELGMVEGNFKVENLPKQLASKYDDWSVSYDESALKQTSEKNNFINLLASLAGINTSAEAAVDINGL